MNANRTSMRITTLMGLLGAAALLGITATAHADQGKWWKPKESRRVVERRESYRAPAWHAPRHVQPGPRFYRPWNGYRVYRERVWVGPGWGAHRRPAYGWRYYCPPSYYYPRHVVYVRPIRFFLSASAVIGGVHVNVGAADPGDVYGCNFCDARFHSFHAYETHVGRCSHAPDGFRVVARDWESDAWGDRSGHDDRNWSYEEQD